MCQVFYCGVVAWWVGLGVCGKRLLVCVGRWGTIRVIQLVGRKRVKSAFWARVERETSV